MVSHQIVCVSTCYKQCVSHTYAVKRQDNDVIARLCVAGNSNYLHVKVTTCKELKNIHVYNLHSCIAYFIFWPKSSIKEFSWKIRNRLLILLTVFYRRILYIQIGYYCFCLKRLPTATKTICNNLRKNFLVWPTV